jgi:hypothetical protein
MVSAAPRSGFATVDRVKVCGGVLRGARNSGWCKSDPRENETRGDLVCLHGGDMVLNLGRNTTTVL